MSSATLSEAVSALGESLDSFSLGGATEIDVFQNIFRLNSELGKLARADPSLRPLLIEIQSRINTVTIEVKGSNAQGAAEAFREAASRLEPFLQSSQDG